jgi:hypothetical protein
MSGKYGKEWLPENINLKRGTAFLNTIFMNKTEKSFVDYFVENQKIDTAELKCIRTFGWGNEAVLRVEYADYHKDYRPFSLAKKYLKEVYSYCPKHLVLNPAQRDS